MDNPFNYNMPVSPKQFVGRWDMVRAVATDLGRETGNSHAIIGGRRFGKSSVLNALWHEAMKPTSDTRTWATLPIYVGAKSLDGLHEGRGLYAKALHEIKVMVSGAHPSIGAPECPFRMDASRVQWPDFDQPEKVSKAEFERVIKEVSELAKDSRFGFLRIVVLVDETEALLNQPWTVSFFGNLRSLIYDPNAECARRLLFVFAGSSRLLDQEGQTSPLPNALTHTYLEAMEDASVRKLAARFAGLPAEVSDWIVTQSGGHPYIAQYLLHELWEKAYCDGALTVQLAEIAAQKMRDDRHNDFLGWWTAVGDDGQMSYRRLMQSEGWVEKKGLGKIEGLRDLRCHGLIRHDSTSDRYCIAGRLFRTWVDQESPVAPPPQSGSDVIRVRQERTLAHWRLISEYETKRATESDARELARIDSMITKEWDEIKRHLIEYAKVCSSCGYKVQVPDEIRHIAAHFVGAEDIGNMIDALLTRSYG